MRILISLSLLAWIIVPASSALAGGSGGVGIRLVDVPANSRNDPLGGSYIIDRLAPGASLTRRVEIVNTTDSTVTVAVYPAGAGLRRGAFVFGAGHSRNELSSWTSASRDVLPLPPRTKAFDTVTIDVPEGASSGERYAVIWAEVSAPAPASGGVTLVNRVGVRMYVSIGPGGASRSSFAIGSLTAERSENGAPLVAAIVHNTGPRALAISGNLTLSNGPGALRAGPLPVRLESGLAPGDSRSVIVRLDERLPRGPWRAQIRLRSGLIEHSAVATITFPALVGVTNPPTASIAPAQPPYLMIVIVSLLVLLTIAIALRVRCRAGWRSSLRGRRR